MKTITLKLEETYKDKIIEGEERIPITEEMPYTIIRVKIMMAYEKLRDAIEIEIAKL